LAANVCNFRAKIGKDKQLQASLDMYKMKGENLKAHAVYKEQKMYEKMGKPAKNYSYRKTEYRGLLTYQNNLLIATLYHNSPNASERNPDSKAIFVE
jgi:hypothetical protein